MRPTGRLRGSGCCRRRPRLRVAALIAHLRTPIDSMMAAGVTRLCVAVARTSRRTTLRTGWGLGWAGKQLEDSDNWEPASSRSRRRRGHRLPGVKQRADGTFEHLTGTGDEVELGGEEFGRLTDKLKEATSRAPRGGGHRQARAGGGACEGGARAEDRADARHPRRAEGGHGERLHVQGRRQGHPRSSTTT